MEEAYELHSFKNQEASASSPPPRRSSRVYRRQRSRAAERESVHEIALTQQILDFLISFTVLPKLENLINHARADCVVVQNRRSIIAEKMQEIHELLPASSKAKKGDYIAIIDDALAYIKYLREHIMEACMRKLEYESVSAPLSSMEGYRHYYPQEPIAEEPAEEVFRILIENDPATAFRQMESHGLYLVPITLIDTLHCSK